MWWRWDGVGVVVRWNVLGACERRRINLKMPKDKFGEMWVNECVWHWFHVHNVSVVYSQLIFSLLSTSYSTSIAETSILMFECITQSKWIQWSPQIQQQHSWTDSMNRVQTRIDGTQLRGEQRDIIVFRVAADIRWRGFPLPIQRFTEIFLRRRDVFMIHSCSARKNIYSNKCRTIEYLLSGIVLHIPHWQQSSAYAVPAESVTIERYGPYAAWTIP